MEMTKGRHPHLVDEQSMLGAQCKNMQQHLEEGARYVTPPTRLFAEITFNSGWVCLNNRYRVCVMLQTDHLGARPDRSR